MDALGVATGAVPANELRQVTTTLWTSIEASINRVELPEVRRALGVTALEENERLMEEATALAEIIGDVRHRVDTAAHRRLNAQKSLYANPTRALVEGELRLLIASIKKCAAGDGSLSASASSSVAGSRPHSRQGSRPGSHQGARPPADVSIAGSDVGDGSANDGAVAAGDAEAATDKQSGASGAATRLGGEDESVTRLLASTDEERALLEYVTKSARDLTLGGGNRAPSASSSRPQSSSRPSSSHSSLSSAAAAERLGRKISAFDVDAVAGRLRELVSLEKEALLEDIEIMRRCLEDEAEFMVDAVGRAADDAKEEAREARGAEPPPDVAELRRYGARLRGVYAEEKERVEHEARVERLIGGREKPGAKETKENAPGGRRAGRLEPVAANKKEPAGQRRTDDARGAPRVFPEAPLAPAPPPSAPRPPAGGRAAAFRRRVG